VSEILPIDSVLRPKNGKNSTKKGKNGKNPFLQTKILKLLHRLICTIWAKKKNLFFKKSSVSFKSTYKTKKNKKFDDKLLPTNRTTVHGKAQNVP
jgi:hypothetical protein